jgi:hypothetical protein
MRESFPSSSFWLRVEICECCYARSFATIATVTTVGRNSYDGTVMTLELFATLAAGLFSGASIYINLVEHPARMQCGTAQSLAQWRPSYKRATVMQAGLAAVGFLSATAAWMLGAEGLWLIGGILLGLVIPFTLIVILPTNRRLGVPDIAKESPDTRRLLDRWARLHAVRSVLSFGSFLVFLFLLSRHSH